MTEPSRRCTATTAAGHPCRAYAVHGTDPPRCAPHRGGKTPVGAPAGNTNAQPHGFYAAQPDAVSIANTITGLSDKLERMDDLLPRLENPDHLIAVFSIYTQATSRLGRLLRPVR